MAIYYVSKSGNDSNNGLGADASHATNKPWLTIGKALGAAGIASGDTVHIGPGVYRETVVVGMTSAVAETIIRGDPLNTLGFKDGSGNLLAPEPVRWTAWTTDDKTTPAAARSLQLAARDFLTFENIWFVGSGGNVPVIGSDSTGAATNITFRNCFIHATSGSNNARAILVSSTGAPEDTALNWVIDRCIIVAQNSTAIDVIATSSTIADYDLNFVIKNSIICVPTSNGHEVSLQKSGANSFLAGGVVIQNCTLFGCLSGLRIATGGSTTFPCKVYNCLIVNSASTAALVGVTAGDILEDYNVINAQTARTNVTAGANSVVTYAPLIECGQSQLFGFLPKMSFSPTIDSPLLGFGSDASVSFTEDLLGRARPSGPGITWANISKAVGALEYHDFGTENTSVPDGGSGSCVQLTGPGDHEFEVPVDALASVISVKVRFDSATYGGTDYPQVELVAAPEIGVSAETETATIAASDAWETLTFSSITPTRKSWVSIRFKNRSTSGSGICYIDTLAVA